MMSAALSLRAARLVLRLLGVLWLAAFNPAVFAGPGAHGPGGEHLDAPPAGKAGERTSPRLEAASEAFELVARLKDGELSILIDRYATNEPVVDARVEVESAGLKAVATFHADHGDYVVDDAALLKKLAEPGEHALVFTVIAGQDTDLLDGILAVHVTATHADDHAHSPLGVWATLGVVLLVLGVLALGIMLARRAARRGALQ